MITYQFAKLADGSFINIDDIGESNRNRQFYCIGCSSKMSPVLPKEKAKHFRHTTYVCSRETYLHKLGKLVIKHRFDNNSNFNIKYYAINNCKKFNSCELKKYYQWDKCRNLKDLHTLDLKNYYDTCSEEITYNGFKGDLVLTHSQFPKRQPLFIEIAVTHKCTDEKIRSGIKIIEISIQDEAILKEISLSDFTITQNDKVSYYNFKEYIQPNYILDIYGFDRLLLKPSFHNESCYIFHEVNNSKEIFKVGVLKEFYNDETMMRNYAFLKSIDKDKIIKFCLACSKWSICRIPFKDNQFDLNGHRVLNRSIPISKLNRVELATNCREYNFKPNALEKILNQYKDIPLIER